MTKIQIVSDLHAEFHSPDSFHKLAHKLHPGEADILVIAGDLGSPRYIYSALAALKAAGFGEILYIPGNHEFWGTSHLKGLLTMTEACKSFNVRLLCNKLIEIDGIRFLGTTLWFRDQPVWNELYSKHFRDFEQIENLAKWVYKENDIATKFLSDNIEEGDIVITHHLPSPKSIHPRWKTSSINNFFLCDMSETIITNKPAYWIHGHTHDSFNYELSNTRIICNPYGYYRVDINASFNPYKIIEV